MSDDPDASDAPPSYQSVIVYELNRLLNFAGPGLTLASQPAVAGQAEPPSPPQAAVAEPVATSGPFAASSWSPFAAINAAAASSSKQEQASYAAPFSSQPPAAPFSSSPSPSSTASPFSNSSSFSNYASFSAAPQIPFAQPPFAVWPASSPFDEIANDEPPSSASPFPIAPPSSYQPPTAYAPQPGSWFAATSSAPSPAFAPSPPSGYAPPSTPAPSAPPVSFYTTAPAAAVAESARQPPSRPESFPNNTPSTYRPPPPAPRASAASPPLAPASAPFALASPSPNEHGHNNASDQSWSGSGYSRPNPSGSFSSRPLPVPGPQRSTSLRRAPPPPPPSVTNQSSTLPTAERVFSSYRPRLPRLVRVGREDLAPELAFENELLHSLESSVAEFSLRVFTARHAMNLEEDRLRRVHAERAAAHVAAKIRNANERGFYHVDVEMDMDQDVPWALTDGWEPKRVFRQRPFILNAIQNNFSLTENLAGVNVKLEMRSLPFSYAASRVCYHVRNDKGQKMVIKARHSEPYLNDGELNMRFFMEDILAHFVATKMATLFNNIRKLSIPEGDEIRYIDAMVLQSSSILEGYSMWMLETKLEGKFEKFNGNDGGILLEYEMAQTFSHFSYTCSRGQYMVVDVQGVYDAENKIYHLTDPAIHSKTLQFGMTDLGEKGFDKFFANHTCNQYCKRLKLETYLRRNPGT